MFSVLLLESSAQSSQGPLMVGTNPLHATFPEDPVGEYSERAEILLNKLGLWHLWRKESCRLKKQEAQRLCDAGSAKEVEADSNKSDSPAVMVPTTLMTQVISKIRTDHIGYGDDADKCLVSMAKDGSKRKKEKKVRERKRKEMVEQSDETKEEPPPDEDATHHDEKKEMTKCDQSMLTSTQILPPVATEQKVSATTLSKLKAFECDKSPVKKAARRVDFSDISPVAPKPSEGHQSVSFSRHQGLFEEDDLGDLDL